mmetsp:Transcript_24025/g.42907  ORF Transcript_24025/g.42907 Transcript_24025/m.42907 type:complete len:206 (-) Transcript_24025:144-761(-)
MIGRGSFFTSLFTSLFTSFFTSLFSSPRNRGIATGKTITAVRVVEMRLQRSCRHGLIAHACHINHQFSNQLIRDLRADVQLALRIQPVLRRDDDVSQKLRHSVQLLQALQAEVAIMDSVVFRRVIDVGHLTNVVPTLLLIVEALQELVPTVEHKEIPLAPARLHGNKGPFFGIHTEDGEAVGETVTPLVALFSHQLTQTVFETLH